MPNGPSQVLLSARKPRFQRHWPHDRGIQDDHSHGHMRAGATPGLIAEMQRTTRIKKMVGFRKADSGADAVSKKMTPRGDRKPIQEPQARHNYAHEVGMEIAPPAKLRRALGWHSLAALTAEQTPQQTPTAGRTSSQDSSRPHCILCNTGLSKPSYPRQRTDGVSSDEVSGQSATVSIYIGPSGSHSALARERPVQCQHEQPQCIPTDPRMSSPRNHRAA